ncbi:FAD-dependent oxidoreductase [Dyadobacter chenwenxiniae]|uniref:FAD-dependent oxidoreductase n=1 Tax=Dyadobacter chenwenxiniae TaxID=2906456 RepID=A0A9X1PSK3_9BACT|nr:FAD-dependent oxidoreductase [Dyadobacter chenwenxiniae]MCF0065294.1 FAD-dependent oxidoreductase [Dyadobacter chenwenxiniae]UON84438.1 FAD-dependent oxidoreductase [Dyadobacter chenwenxiniae]
MENIINKNPGENNDGSQAVSIGRDGHNESLWQKSAVKENWNGALDPSVIYDTLIVGAGITGITTALLLQKAGHKCVIAEAHNPGYGTTGGTTAHINTFADTTFAEVEKAFDKQAAKQFAESIAESVALIAANVRTYNLDCDFRWQNAYVYAETDKEVDELKDLFESALRVGVTAEIADHAPAPVPYQKAVVFDKQAQFHPLKYITGLQKQFTDLGGIVLENTRIEEIESQDDFHIAKSGERQIKAKAVVYATHIPPGGVNVLHFRNAPYRSYVIAALLNDDNYPDALVYDMQDPYHYFRTHEIDGQKYLIAGGHDHKTGHGDPQQSFTDLINYTKRCYEVKSIHSQWSAQYYVPADGLPYIGHLPGASNGIYTATGFNGNGMILGTVSAIVLSDLILKGQSTYESLFNPGRVKPIAGFMETIKENADVIGRFIGDRFGLEEIESVSEIPVGSGEIVTYKDQKLAIYKDPHGKIHALNPVCTHTKCIVNWNNSEKTWDCPCHGARFDTEGVVLTGPARADLEKVNIGPQA